MGIDGSIFLGCGFVWIIAHALGFMRWRFGSRDCDPGFRVFCFLERWAYLGAPT